MKDKKKAYKRSINEVNGYKVNHPHSAANIFYSIFTLLLVAIPVGMLFVPMMKLPTGTSVMGIEYAKLLFKGFVIEDDGASGLYDFVNNYASSGNLAVVSKYLIFGQAGIWALMALLGVIALILFIINLCRGYLKKSKGPKTIGGLMLILTIFLGLSFLVFYLVDIIDKGASQLVPWLSFIPAGASLIVLIVLGILYSHNFQDCVLEKDLEYHEDDEGNVVTHVTEVHNVTKVKYEQASTLPTKLTSIGGHAYSQNQSLVIANIPLGIKSLGNGAFANCLKLRVVSIPTSVKSIGENCFFNCASLERINYAGSKEQWRKISRGANWLAKAKATQVICVDGALVVNPYH